MRDEIKQMNKVIKKTDFYNIHDRQKFVIDQKQKFMMKTQAFAPQDSKIYLQQLIFYSIRFKRCKYYFSFY